MPRAINWDSIREKYLSGMPPKVIAETPEAKEYKLSPKAIGNKANKAGWVALKEEIDGKTADKLTESISTKQADGIENLRVALEQRWRTVLVAADRLLMNMEETPNGYRALGMKPYVSPKDLDVAGKAYKAAQEGLSQIYRVPRVFQHIGDIANPLAHTLMPPLSPAEAAEAAKDFGGLYDSTAPPKRKKKNKISTKKSK